MHDRWKAGVSGCQYFYSAAGPVTQIAITLGTLQQIIDAGSIEGGAYTLSWQGTSVARIDTGAYNVSPLRVTGLAAGVSHTVEFNTGTVSMPQFETGDTASQFEIRHRRTTAVQPVLRRRRLRLVWLWRGRVSRVDDAPTAGADARQPGARADACELQQLRRRKPDGAERPRPEARDHRDRRRHLRFHRHLHRGD